MKVLLLCLMFILIACFVLSDRSFGAEPHKILSARMVIDGKPDADLEQKATAFQLTQVRIGGGIGPYTAYLCFDAENIYVACSAKDDFVSCLDGATRDFMDSDYFRFYICVGEDFKDRQTLNGKTDWAIIFAPQDTKGNWKPMVRECPYNGPGHGAIEGDNITPKRASSAIDGGWYLEAAIPFSLFGTTYKELSKLTFGIYFVAGDTDKSGARTGEMSIPDVDIGSYWESPACWQASILGQLLSVNAKSKIDNMWGWIKAGLY